MKLSVGVANAIRSAQTFISGGAKLVAGGPFAPVGAAQVGVFAPSLLTRGGLQIREALSEGFFDATPRNLLGLAPAGQAFDDPDEPTLFQYIDQLATQFEEDPSAAIAQFLQDYQIGLRVVMPDDEEKPEEGGLR